MQLYLELYVTVLQSARSKYVSQALTHKDSTLMPQCTYYCQTAET